MHRVELARNREILRGDTTQNNNKTPKWRAALAAFLILPGAVCFSRPQEEAGRQGLHLAQGGKSWWDSQKWTPKVVFLKERVSYEKKEGMQRITQRKMFMFSVKGEKAALTKNFQWQSGWKSCFRPDSAIGPKRYSLEFSLRRD